MNFLRAYTFPILQLVGVIAIAGFSLWFSVWYSTGEEEYLQSTNPPLTSASFWDVTKHHIRSLRTPVPYTLLSFVIALVGGLGIFKNQSKINKYDDLENRHREEKVNHGDTQKNYYEAIDYIINSIFVSMNGCWDDSCRITIYRRQNDDRNLQRIYRHAGQTRYESGGRIRIPSNEGIVGAAWLNQGIAHISISSGFGTQAYNQQLERELERHDAVLPSSNTRMPTRSYFAMAIRKEDRSKMAVIVLESTKEDKFSEENRASLEDTIKRENGKISKYIVHKGMLDKILNPDGDLENG